MSLEDTMKKIILIAIALVSVSSFAGKEDYRERVRVTGPSAQVAYDRAVDMVAELKGARGNTRFSYLKKCNLKRGERDVFFRRNAWTNSGSVTVNHVTGVYTAIVHVKCRR